MQEIRIGIIGTGVISKTHMNNYKDIPNAKVVAACDIDKAKLANFGQEWGIEDLYTDYRDMLKREDIDNVDVCLHNNLHLPMSYEVLKSGKNCYCEKPMAGSYKDALTLYNASKAFDKNLAIQLAMLFNPASRLGKKMIEDGELGRIYHARSTGYRRRLRPGLDIPPPFFAKEFISKKWAEHGALYDMGVYHISRLLFMMGIPELERVSGRVYQEIDYKGAPAKDAGMEVEELGVGLAFYKNGLTLDIIESWAINMDDFGSSFIAGSKGGIRLTTDTIEKKNYPGLKFFTQEGNKPVDKDLIPSENPLFDPEKDPEQRYYQNDQAHWIAYLAGDLKERIDTPWLALQTMLVSEGIFLSSKLGREISADEIESLSETTAMRQQETEWGTFNYDFN